MSLMNLDKQFKKTHKLILMGQKEPLIYLFAEYKAKEFTNELYYQKDKESIKFRIF